VTAQVVQRLQQHKIARAWERYNNNWGQTQN